MDISQLPALNATLNATAGVLLLCGWIAIKRGEPLVHRKLMIAAFMVSILFLTSYIYYHYNTPGMTKYSGTGILRFIYFAILITHIPLAMAVPFGALVALWFAYRKRFDRHKRMTRWLWPIWMYVSVTGVLIYVMLYV